MGLGLVDKLDCDFAKSRKQAVGQKTHDTLAYHLFMMRTDGAEGYGWTLFFKSFCTLACLGYCCCCMAIQPFQAVLLQVCVCVSVYALLRE